MLPLTLVFIYRHQCSFSSNKKLLFGEKLFLFLEKRIHSKDKQLLLADFSLIRFFRLTFFDDFDNYKKH